MSKKSNQRVAVGADVVTRTVYVKSSGYAEASVNGEYVNVIYNQEADLWTPADQPISADALSAAGSATYGRVRSSLRKDRCAMCWHTAERYHGRIAYTGGWPAPLQVYICTPCDDLINDENLRYNPVVVAKALIKLEDT